MLLGLSVITFALANFMPGDVVDFLMNPADALSGEVLQAQREAMGLNKPVHIRYSIWLAELTRGNMGYSFVTREPVTRRIGQRLGNTMLLMGTAIIGGFMIALPLGVLLAVRQYSVLDYLLTSLAFVSISIPTFFLGLAAIYFLSVRLDLFPVSGTHTIGAAFSLADRIQHLVLPAAVLGAYEVARFMRYMRSSMLEVIHEQYVVTARSKGLAERKVLFRHAMRNAILPIITVMGLLIPSFFAGAVVTEQIFQWPGIGMLTIEALNARDYPVILGINLAAGFLVLLGSLLADIGYAVADPRIRYDGDHS
jgi:peptide/nickel transport system permease protein